MNQRPCWLATTAPLFDQVGTKCKHPLVHGRLIAYIATRRPDWCPLDQHPLYLRTTPL